MKRKPSEPRDLPCRWCGKLLKNTQMGRHSMSCRSNPSFELFESKRKIRKPMSPEGRRGISEAHKKLTHRRVMRSTRPYINKDGSEVLLDSFWEELLAKRLDDLEIDWIRPSTPIFWIDREGNSRSYYPDFFLIEFKVFLDPKGPGSALIQKEKIEWIKKNRSDVVFIMTKTECEQFMPS